VLSLLAGCAAGHLDADAEPLDAVDARAVIPDAAAPPPDAARGDAGPSADAGRETDGRALPYRHTIAIDGANDFTAASEAFTTTSAGYTAYASWDDASIYLGYEGADVASSDAARWVLVFFDVDPGGAGGATVGEAYNTQQPGMPAGFTADFAFRWRASNDFQQLQAYGGGAWSDTGATPATYQTGTFLETAIPRSVLGDPSALAITALMINETGLSEGSYAGLYAGSFTDGYYDASIAPIPLTRFLLADLASDAAPNDPSNQRP
jgi:hypothetical protein